ncbi:MAG: sialidase family protein, partial [bacterium]
MLSSKIFSQNVWSPTGQMFGTADNVRSIAATHNGDLYASSWARGIYKSTNLGVTWSLSGLAGKRVSNIVNAPNGDIYALSKTVDSSYIHRSSNEGNTWTNVFVGSFPLNYAGGGSIVFPSDGSIVAAFSVTVGPTVGNVSGFVYKSTDNGNSWFRTVQIGGGFVGGMTITSDNKILIGTSLSGVFFSTNNGNSFAHLGTFPSVFIRTIIKAEDDAVYVSDAFGLSRSTDNGASWVNVGSQQSTSYLRDAIATPDGTLYISMDDRKVFHSTNRGDEWIQINDGLPSESYLYCFGYSSGKLFGGT